VIVASAIAYRFWSTSQEENSIIIGGDKDEGGCLIAAGYSWCEAKQKCLRIFEEDCLSIEGITSVLATKHRKLTSEVFIEIIKENTEYAAGQVWYDQRGGEGGVFLATKTEAGWEIVFDGNGSIDCERIKQEYTFPEDMLIGFCD